MAFWGAFAKKALSLGSSRAIRMDRRVDRRTKEVGPNSLPGDPLGRSLSSALTRTQASNEDRHHARGVLLRRIRDEGDPVHAQGRPALRVRDCEKMACA